MAISFKGLLGSMAAPQNQYNSLLGIDPRAARWNAVGGFLEGAGVGLMTGDWSKGLEASNAADERFQRQQLLGYEMKKQADNQAYDREQDTKTWDWREEQAKIEQANRDRSFALQQAEFGYRQKSDALDRQAAGSGESWRVASPEEKAMLGLPPDAPAIITKNGPKIISDGGTSVNVNTGGGTEKQIFEETKAVTDAARSAAAGLSALTAAGQSLPGAITGAAANERLALQKIATLFGADASAVQDTETFRSAIAPQVAAMLKATVGSAQISNADREFAEKAAGGSITLDKGSIERLLNIMRAANSEVVRRQNQTLDTVYPEGAGFDRERSLFNVPNVPKAYPSPIGPQAPNAGAVAPTPRRTSTGIPWSIE